MMISSSTVLGGPWLPSQLSEKNTSLCCMLANIHMVVRIWAATHTCLFFHIYFFLSTNIHTYLSTLLPFYFSLSLALNGKMINNELERILKDALMAWIKVLSRYFLEWLRKFAKNLSAKPSSGRDWNPGLSNMKQECWPVDSDSGSSFLLY
jgi:hypothetical protein